MEKFITVYKSDYYISKEVTKDIVTKPRTVSHFEIELYTTSGNTSVINGVEYLQEKNNILVARPGDIRYSINSFECYCLHFSCELDEVVTTLSQLPRVFKPQGISDLRAAFEELYKAYNTRRPGQNLLIQAKTLELISLLANEHNKTPIEKYERYAQNITAACDFIAKHFDEHISLIDIAAASSLSPCFFHTVFKMAKQMTPREYLMKIRMSMAKNLLRNSDKPLSDIAIQCGFESQSYFNYIFKKQTNITPKKYRDNQRIII